MSDIKDRLNALLAHKGLMSGAQWRAQMADQERRREAGEYEIDKIVSGEAAGEGDSHFYLVKNSFPLDTRHGCMTLGAALDTIPEHIALSACDESIENFDPATTLFIDTETMGLAGGAGTVAFLVGLGYFSENAFHLEQCFMRDYDEEVAMLRHLDGLFARCESVVSYNGKSFDAPLLRNRFIANRLPFRLDSVLHLDLVHAARRFWKGRLDDCRLNTIERTILGVFRHDDVNAAEIPEIWFEYLRTRDARKLERVFYHHRLDVLSLVSLTAWLSRSLAVPGGQGFEHVQDRLALVRIQFGQKRYTEAVRTAKAVLEEDADEALRRECLELLGLACKRLRDWNQMEETWNVMMEQFPKDLVPRLELAKYHEHRTRNLPEAERICQTTIDFLETRRDLGRDVDIESVHIETFRVRLERIRRKLGKAGPLDLGD